MNKQVLVKLATVRLAINHVLRQRYTTKQAGLFKKKYEKPDWYNDEDAVNQFVKDYAVWGPFSKSWETPAAIEAYNKDPSKAHEAINNFNAHMRVNRHSDRSASLIDRYFDLLDGNYDPTYRPMAYKGDRYDSLVDAGSDIYRNFDYLPEDKKEEAKQLLKEINTYLDEYEQIDPNKPYTPKSPYFDVSEEMLKEPLTRKDVGSLEDATPKQIETWKRQSKKSPLWSYLWPILTGAGTGALIGSQLKDSRGDKGTLALGLMGALVGGIPGLLNGDHVSKEKQYAERRLNEK